MKRTKKTKVTGDLVAMDYDLGHFNIFSVGEERFSGRRVQSVSKNERWEFHSTEHPLFSDLGIYLGVLKAFEKFKHEDRLNVVGDDEVIEISKSELCSFCGLAPNGKHQKKIEEVLFILDLFTARRYRTWGENKEVRKFKLLEVPKFKEKRGRYSKITIKMSVELREWIKDNNMLVRFREIQAIKGQVERALFVYVECNKCESWISQSYIFRYLGITPPIKPNPGSSRRLMAVYEEALEAYKLKEYEIVRQIKEGLESLRAKELIRGFDIKKQPQGIFYSIQKLSYKEAKANSEKRATASAKAKKETRKTKSAKDLTRDLERIVPTNMSVQCNLADFKAEEIPY